MFRPIVTLAAGLWLTLVFATSAPAAGAAGWSLPSDAEIRRILADRIDLRHQGVGMVVGVIDAHGRRIVAYGALDQGDPRPLNGDTVFEIGSASKVFTTLVLAQMAQDGEVKLDDPAADYAPAGAALPERGGRRITLIDLATHTSGLPRLPGNLQPKDMANPYADYTTDQLYSFLGRYALTRDIGSKYEYSNLGVGLLGDLLARRAGESYAAMVHDRITGPLGMTSTVVALTPGLRARLATGHDPALKPVANWDLPALAGAGALRSTADDLLTFLSAELGYADTPLKAAMKAQLAPRRPTGAPGLEIALGWHVLTGIDGGLVWHNGGTGGYRSFLAFDPKTGAGVVVLSNVGDEQGVDDIGMHILAGTPLLPAPVVHHAIAVEAGTLERYVGVYQLTPKVTIAITRDGDRLFLAIAGQPTFELFPEQPDGFFLKAVDAQVSFVAGPDAKIASLVLHQAGHDQVAPRLPAARP